MERKLSYTDALNYCYQVGAIGSSQVSDYVQQAINKGAGYFCAQNIQALGYCFKIGAIGSSQVSDYVYQAIKNNSRIGNVSFTIRGLADSYKSGALGSSQVSNYIYSLLNK